MKTVYSSTDTRGLSSRDRRRVSLSARGAARARSGGKRGNLSALESRLHAALPAKDQRRPQAGRAREGRELPPAPAPCSHEGAQVFGLLLSGPSAAPEARGLRAPARGARRLSWAFWPSPQLSPHGVFFAAFLPTVIFLRSRMLSGMSLIDMG